MTLLPHQTRFLEFLVTSGVLRFGEFTVKSGRKSPYYLNFGNINTGRLLKEAASLYAEHILSMSEEVPNVIFGPAYKGIPLAAAIAEALSDRTGKEIYFSFNRKEVKTHGGDKGMVVGRQPQSGDRILIVEDVVTAGTTFREVVPLLNQLLSGAKIVGALVGVDRCERGSGERSALKEIREDLALPIEGIVNIYQIIQNLSSEILSDEDRQRSEDYLKQFSVRE